MYLALGIVLILVSVSLHELGHAFTMARHGVKISKIGIGFKIPMIPNISWESKRFFPGAKIELNHIPILAFVMPKTDDEGDDMVKDLDFRAQAEIFGAGVMANLYFFLAMLIVCVVLKAFVDGRYEIIAFTTYHFNEYAQIAILLCFVGLLYIFRHLFCEHIMPVLGTLLLILVVYSVTQAPAESVGGPVSIGADIKKNSTDILSTLYFAGYISFQIALFNMLPLLPLDGGQVVSAKLHKVESRFSGYYEVIGVLVFLGLIGLAFKNDAFRLFDFFK
jgi:membrane-associated protease RseP (regulator of RpoE activity)